MEEDPRKDLWGSLIVREGGVPSETRGIHEDKDVIVFRSISEKTKRPKGKTNTSSS